MNKSMIGIGAFTLGGVLGFVAADKLMKQKYEQLVQDEIDSVKAVFKQNAKAAAKEEAAPDEKASEEKAVEVAVKTESDPPKPTEKQRQNYSQYSAELGYTSEKKPAPAYKPRVISPEEFGDLDGYEQVDLTYYADGTLADDDDRAMSKDEIAETIGMDSLNHFGEYEEDSLFVRNDRLKVDYEILRDERSYAEILSERPYLRN